MTARVLIVDDDPVQRRLLEETATLAQAGLTIVAGSSPMKHGYLLGHQGWHAPARDGQPARDISSSKI